MKTSTFAISPRQFDAVLFDLDGVVAKTAAVHANAWKQLFDEFLEARNKTENKSFSPFDVDKDYRKYVDGKPRYEGVKSLLESRGIDIPYGSPGDPPDKETICGLGNRKNRYFHEHLQKEGVEVYASTIDLIHQLHEVEIKTAIISSSKNCSAVLKQAGITHLFAARVDGTDLDKLDLAGKPAPDVFVEAARRLGVVRERSIIVEDALSGVEAGKRGGFGCTLGVDRAGHAKALKEHGADVVVNDLSEVSVKADKKENREE